MFYYIFVVGNASFFLPTTFTSSSTLTGCAHHLRGYRLSSAFTTKSSPLCIHLASSLEEVYVIFTYILLFVPTLWASCAAHDICHGDVALTWQQLVRTKSQAAQQVKQPWRVLGEDRSPSRRGRLQLAEITALKMSSRGWPRLRDYQGQPGEAGAQKSCSQLYQSLPPARGPA